MFKWKKLIIILSLGLFGLSNQAVAKFMSVDPVGALQHISQGNVQGFNRYAYANNNPYKYVDPDGRIPVIPIAVFVVKELAGEVFEQTTGIPAPTIKNAGKAITKQALRKATGPALKTTKEATKQAQKLGYKEVKGAKTKTGEKVFHNKRGSPKFITRDRDGHKGGAFKGADKAKDLNSKETRSGTYDKDMERVDN